MSRNTPFMFMYVATIANNKYIHNTGERRDQERALEVSESKKNPKRGRDKACCRGERER